MSDGVTLISGPGMQSGVGAPSNDMGSDNDRYLDTNSGNFYQKINGIWVFQASFGVYTILRDVKSRLTTNASGVWTKTYPANFWTGEPSINVTPVMPTGNGTYTAVVQKTLNAGAWTVTVTFMRIAPNVTIAVLGSVNIVVAPGTVAFDYSATEPNA